MAVVNYNLKYLSTCLQGEGRETTMTTPDISHLTSKDYQFIYEPAEDTFLLIDAIEKDLELIIKLRPTLCVEIGSGSGICSTFLARELRSTAFTLCTDINERAAETSRKTAEVNKVCSDQVITDLVSGLSERLQDQVDVLLFNPPYVVTPSDEVGSHGIEASWAGGERGREVIDRVLPLVPKLLSKQGLFYLVIIKENDPVDIEQIMKTHGLKMTTVLTRKTGPEFLSVLRFNR